MTQDAIYITLVIYGILVGAGLFYVGSTLTNKVKQLNCKYLYDRLAKQVSANLLLKEQNSKLNNQKHYLVTDREFLRKQVHNLEMLNSHLANDYSSLNTKYKTELAKTKAMTDRIQSNQPRYYQ